MRGGRDAKPQTVTLHHQHCLRESRDSRGRRRSRGASVDTALACARVAQGTAGIASGARAGIIGAR